MLSQAIFILFFAISTWLFGRTVYTRLLPMRHAKGVFAWDRLPYRFWRVFKEVAMQSRVVQRRPVVGVLHAVVMWGFAAFAWVSVEHLWIGFRGFGHAQNSSSWYGYVAASWAIAVLVGISGLAFRRFVLRPKALGHVSPTSGLVAGLIAMLMLTYLAGWRVFPLQSIAGQANWWLHTLALFTLLAFIPRSKHLHLMLAPLAIFFRSETVSSLRALRADDDTDLGLIHFRDLEKKDILDLHACVECGRCTDVCPAHLAGDSLNPKQVILQMQHGLLAGGERICGSAASLKQGSAWVDQIDIFQCLSCGACESACPVGIEHVGRKILDLRRGLVSEGNAACPKAEELFVTMERAPHNPWGVGQDMRRKFIKAENFPVFDGSQEWLFWLGCGISYDAHGQEVARAMKKILDKSGVCWGVLESETCCGEPARRAGNEGLFFQLSEKLIAALQNGRVKNIVCCCPHCTRMFDDDYRQLPDFAVLGIHVEHHTRFIQNVMPQLGIKPTALTLTYHDPCYLARGLDSTKDSRSILQACGATIQEMPRHGQHTFCCGAGGAQLFIADDRTADANSAKSRVNHLRFTEAMDTGVATIAVACPYCPVMLKDAALHAKRDDVQILDVAEIVAGRLYIA